MIFAPLFFIFALRGAAHAQGDYPSRPIRLWAKVVKAAGIKIE